MSETSFIKRFDITLDLKQPGCGGDFSVVDGTRAMLFILR